MQSFCLAKPGHRHWSAVLEHFHLEVLPEPVVSEPLAAVRLGQVGLVDMVQVVELETKLRLAVRSAQNPLQVRRL